MSTIRLSGLGAIAWTDSPTSDWACADWMYWHQQLVKASLAGSFPSKIKYSQADALKNANTIFLQWWKSTASFTKSNFCGYKSDWYAYFDSVGLGDEVLSYFQAATSGAVKLTETVTQTAQKVLDTASNTASVTKYLLPIALIGAVGLVGMYAYNHYVRLDGSRRSLRGVRRKRKRVKSRK